MSDETPGTEHPTAVVKVVGAAILRHGTFIAAQRHRNMAEPLKWEFPGGKIEAGEDPRQALAREIREELALEIAVGAWLGRGTHEEGGRRIVLDVFTATVVAGEIRLAEHRRAGWFRASEIDDLDWAAADRPVLPALRRLLAGAGRSAASG